MRKNLLTGLYPSDISDWKQRENSRVYGTARVA